MSKTLYVLFSSTCDIDENIFRGVYERREDAIADARSTVEQIFADVPPGDGYEMFDDDPYFGIRLTDNKLATDWWFVSETTLK